MRADQVRPSFLSAAEVRARATERALPLDELVIELLPWASAYARPQISHFGVGAIVLGLSGALYAGGNLEFLGESLSLSVHAEQAAVYNAWLHGETGVMLIGSSATPCGFCRQFLTELPDAGDLRVLVPGRAPATLARLLPASFGPRDLGRDGGLMQGAPLKLALAEPDNSPVTAAALAAAEAAYAPYSRTYAGVGLRTADGFIAQGRYAENAAFNPSLSPMQGALISLALAGRFEDVIEDAVLVEAAAPPTGLRDRVPASQQAVAEVLLAAVAPHLPLLCVRALPAGTAATLQASEGLDSTDTSALS